MNKSIIIAGVGLAAVGLIILSEEKPAKAKSTQYRPDESVHGFPVNYEQFMAAAKSGTELIDAPGSRKVESEQLWYQARDTFAQRRKLLPSDAKGTIDKYSKERYALPYAMWTSPWPHSLYIDEFGREASGLPSDFKVTVLHITQAVLPSIPGIGTAAAAGLAFTIAIGEGKSLKDATLSAARATVPFQYQYAFDLAVGVANGSGIDDAAKQALFKQYPEAEKAYHQGEAIAHSG